MAKKPLTQEMLDRRSYGAGSRARFDPQWAMSRPADWYQNRANLGLIKDTLVRQPAVTTDQGEGRNMYQMLMNQMKGGDRGARLIDTSGLPAGARRIGRTLFTDPAKSQGFFGDVESLFTGKNKAAVRAREYNPFPKAGFGADWYKDQFPIASGLDSLMGLAEKSPTFNMLTSMFPKKARIPLERDPSFLPENNMAPFWELLEDEETMPEDPGWEYPDDVGVEDVTIADLAPLEPIVPDEEIIVPDEEITETFTDLDDTHAFTDSFGWAKGDYSGVQEYVNSIVQDEDNPYYKMDRDELVEILIKQNRIKEK